MDKVKIGVIGVGGRGKIARYLHNPDGRSIVATGADINEQHLQAFKENINSEAFVTMDYRKLLDRQDIDAVPVASPDFCHEEHAIPALQSGKG